MRRYTLPTAGLLTVFLACHTPHPARQTPANPPAETATRTPHTLLWRITGKGSAHPSYLFGTMHILCAADATLSDSLLSAIHSVDEVYFEINLGDLTGMLSAIQYMNMNHGEKLSDLLKPDEYARVKDYFSKHQSMLPFGMLERFKPMLISGLIEEQGLGCATTDGMEMKIMAALREQDNKKPINGLETAAFQASLFDSIPYAKQAKELVDYIDSADQNKEMTRQLADLYVKQDLDGIQALSDKDDPGMDEYMDLLLYDRNRKWARILDNLLPEKSLLIAVGAGHLPGKQGVIELLRKEGYTVEPVFGNKSQSL
ncbi:MAG TPA: TraB/GumN family protein [Puia sp.]|jgi:uncharacterized protein YbaP (TraB family)|nr:TraB/GumN family protein [Puia sp.]